MWIARPTIGCGLTKTFQAASLYSMGFIIVMMVTMMVTMMVIIIKLILKFIERYFPGNDSMELYKQLNLQKQITYKFF